jgi:hypothetical protein
MFLDEGLLQLYDGITKLNMDKPFPRKADETFCYSELGKHAVLNEVKLIHFSLVEKFIEFLILIGLEDYHATSALAQKIKVEELINMVSSVQPFEGARVPVLIKRLQDKAEEMDVDGYINSVMTLTVLGWKFEVLGDNLLLLKKTLARVCSSYYNSIHDQEEEGLVARADISSRREAIMFGGRRRRLLKPEEMDLSEYIPPQFLYYSVYHLALLKEDDIQAFRSFRKTLRIRKRFGISLPFRDKLVKKDKEMTEKSLSEMGGVHDNLDLRKFEVRLRSEQQIRNLQLKTMVV